jgi:dienelactone hydrolase
MAVDAYFAYPRNRSTEYGLLYLTDGFGVQFPNSQLMADTLATHGYFVIVPDMFDRDPVQLGMPEDFDIAAWFSRHPTNVIDPIIDSCLHTLRSEFGCRRIGAVGYCIGVSTISL